MFELDPDIVRAATALAGQMLSNGISSATLPLDDNVHLDITRDTSIGIVLHRFQLDGVTFYVGTKKPTPASAGSSDT